MHEMWTQMATIQKASDQRTRSMSQMSLPILEQGKTMTYPPIDDIPLPHIMLKGILRDLQTRIAICAFEQWNAKSGDPNTLDHEIRTMTEQTMRWLDETNKIATKFAKDPATDYVLDEE
jgi:hypothetical protein